jgi:hypothetical protein
MVRARAVRDPQPKDGSSLGLGPKEAPFAQTACSSGATRRIHRTGRLGAGVSCPASRSRARTEALCGLTPGPRSSSSCTAPLRTYRRNQPSARRHPAEGTGCRRRCFRLGAAQGLRAGGVLAALLRFVHGASGDPPARAVGCASKRQRRDARASHHGRSSSLAATGGGARSPPARHRLPGRRALASSAVFRSSCSSGGLVWVYGRFELRLNVARWPLRLPLLADLWHVDPSGPRLPTRRELTMTLSARSANHLAAP